jgi:SAM-dependent methyltransferase
MILFGRKTQKTEEKYIYFGSLLPSEEQYKSDLFRGLALSNPHDKDIVHDIRNPLPFQNESIRGFQSQDVFEHVERELVPKIFDEIFRCLVRGGLFRLSLPDYNSPLLRSRSAYDSEGNILGDLALGATLTGIMNGGIDVKFAEDGDAHLWFPTYDQILHLILHSELRSCVVEQDAIHNQRLRSKRDAGATCSASRHAGRRQAHLDRHRLCKVEHRGVDMQR